MKLKEEFQGGGKSEEVYTAYPTEGMSSSSIITENRVAHEVKEVSEIKRDKANKSFV